MPAAGLGRFLTLADAICPVGGAVYALPCRSYTSLIPITANSPSA